MSASDAARSSDHEVTAPPIQSRESLVRQRDDWHAAWLKESRKRRELESALRKIEHWPFDVGHTPERDLREIREVAHDALA